MTRFSHLSLYLVKPLAFSTALFSLSLSLPLSPRLRCVGAGEQVDFNVLTSPSLPTLLLVMIATIIDKIVSLVLLSFTWRGARLTSMHM